MKIKRIVIDPYDYGNFWEEEDKKEEELDENSEQQI